jgi:RNA-directed DNA polymerase
LWKWCLVKHPKTSHKVLAKQYFTTIGNRKWLFYGTVGTNKKYLFQVTDVTIKSHVLVKDKNPFLPEDQEYFLKKGSRSARQQIWGTTKLKVAKKTGFKCKICEDILWPDQQIDIHHILPKAPPIKILLDCIRNVINRSHTPKTPNLLPNSKKEGS